MKRILLAGVLFLVICGIAGALWATDFFGRNTTIPSLQDLTNSTDNQEDIPQLTVIAENLSVPWDIEFLPDKMLLVTERAGIVSRINPTTSEKTTLLTIDSVKQIGEGGMHGVALHPDFADNKYVYIYYTYAGNNNSTLNRVSRFSYTDQSLTDETIVVDAIPGASNHDGGGIAFGPDSLLYISTGDAQEPSLAQNTNSLAGKILRVTDTGEAAPNNPFSNRVYSYGHRNPQGFCWDSQNHLYATEHGPSGAGSGYDEVNRIEAGKNYGWPTIQGNETHQNMLTPLLQSGSSDTWAPASAACLNGSVFFGGLRGNTLYEAIPQNSTATLKTHLNGEIGRIRAVTVGPDSLLYISTSNRDGRGIPNAADDRIIRVNPAKL